MVRLRDALKPVPIYDGNKVVPITLEWLAISRVAEDQHGPETCVLYFLNAQGRPEEFLQFDSLEIAMDQAHAIAGVDQGEWRTCSVVVTSEGPWNTMTLSHPLSG